MRARPAKLTCLALGLAVVALSFPLQIVAMFGDSPLDFLSVALKISLINYVVISLALLLAGLVYRASPLVWLVSPLFLGAVAWNNYLVSSVGRNFSYWVTSGATVLVFGVFSVLFAPECRLILTQPKRRWWLTPARKRLSIEAKVCPVLGGELVSKTFDLSENGAFISLRDAFWSRHRAASMKNLKVGTYCSIQFKFNQMASLSCTAEIVRKAGSAGSYPSGFGVRFVGLNPREKKLLTTYLSQASPSLNTNNIM